MAKQAKLLKLLTAYLAADEVVQVSVLGQYEVKVMGTETTRSGIFAATNQRLVFYSKKLTGYNLESFPYPKISSIDFGKSLLGSHITFYTSGNKVQVKWIVETAELAKFVAYVEDQMVANESISAKPAAVDALTQLQKLAELRNQGIVTEEEFQLKKKQLLDL